MLQIGIGEIFLILVVCLLVLGPEKLPHAVKLLGRYAKAANQLRIKLQKEVEQLNKGDTEPK